MTDEYWIEMRPARASTRLGRWWCGVLGGHRWKWHSGNYEECSRQRCRCRRMCASGPDTTLRPMGDVVPRESAVVNRIMKNLAKQPYCWAKKWHGDGFGDSGVPDIIGCYMGRFFALEVKAPGGSHPVTPLQRWELQQIGNASGLAAIVESWEDVERVLGLDDGSVRPA